MYITNTINTYIYSQNKGDIGRTKYVHIRPSFEDLPDIRRGRSTVEKEPSPYNISIVKGGIQSTLSRQFVEFILYDKVLNKLCYNIN